MKSLIAICALLILGGCSNSLVGPYYVGRWMPQDDPNKVEIPPLALTANGKPLLHVCYNKMLHDAEQIRSLVSENCSGGELVGSELDLYACSLSSPMRATYRCSSLSRAALESRPMLRKTENSTGEIDLTGLTGQGSSRSSQ